MTDHHQQQSRQGPVVASSSRRRIRRAFAVATMMLVSHCNNGGGNHKNYGVSAFSSSRTSTTQWPMTMKLSDTSGRSTSKPSSSSSSSLQDRSSTLSSSKRGAAPPPGSPLAMICKDREEFELHVGHAMDTLRSDYPCILTDKPDFTIYDKSLEVIDPSGVKLHGLENYKSAFSLLHAMINIFYCPERSLLTFRMCYDKARQNIRIHWNAQVIPKAIFGGVKKPLHVDGISVYEISSLSGNITQHRVERLIINDDMVMPEQGIFSALRRQAKKEEVGQIPVFFSTVDGSCGATEECLIGSDIMTSNKHNNNNNHVMSFQSFSPFARQKSTLFFESNSENNSNNNNNSGDVAPTSTSTQLGTMSSSDSAAMSSDSFADLDWEALERKNQSRKKFGLKPISPEEFVELQKQVAKLSSQQQQKVDAAAATRLATQQKEEEKGGFFKKLFGDALQDTCESNYDCQRPEVCCDFGFTKKCCSSGMRVIDGPQSRQGQLAEIPVINNLPPPMNRGRGGSYDGY